MTHIAIKHLFFLLLLVSSIADVLAQEHDVSIIFRGVESSRGKIIIQILNEEARLVNSAAIPAQAEVDGNEASIFKTTLPSGRFAVKAFHDLNGNEELDKDMEGEPIEPHGYSNDVNPNFGMPEMGEQFFMVDRNTRIFITLR